MTKSHLSYLLNKSINHLTQGNRRMQPFGSQNIVPFVFRHQLLSDDDLGPLYDLLIDEPPMIRRAIGELVYDHLIAQNIKTSQPGARGTFLCKHSTFMCQIANTYQTPWSV